MLSAQDGSKTVMIAGADGVAHKRVVTLGLQDSEDVQVLSGLSPTDQVITGGAYGLEDGTKVKIGPAEDDEKKPTAAKGGGAD